MKVAIITDTAIIHGLASGFQSRCSSPAPGAALSDALNECSCSPLQILFL
jgi:hypothetical protein